MGQTPLGSPSFHTERELPLDPHATPVSSQSLLCDEWCAQPTDLPQDRNGMESSVTSIFEVVETGRNKRSREESAECVQQSRSDRKEDRCVNGNRTTRFPEEGLIFGIKCKVKASSVFPRVDDFGVDDATRNCRAAVRARC